MQFHKPPLHNAVSPYLLVKDVKSLIGFLCSTFPTVELFRKAAPDGIIKHAEIQIDDSVIMMGERPDGGVSVVCSTHVYVPDVDECYSKALAAGGISISEPKDQPYGDRTAGVRDPEGNIWWIGTHLGNAS